MKQTIKKKKKKKNRKLEILFVCYEKNIMKLIRTKMKWNRTMMAVLLLLLLLCHCLDGVAGDWNDDVNTEGTLQMIQIVHTHGDRTPSHFVNDDPFIDQTRYWPEGVGQLTRRGRQQMFEIGKYLHNHYETFIRKHLQKQILERILDAQSSATRRCLESTTILVQAFIGQPTTVAFDDKNSIEIDDIFDADNAQDLDNYTYSSEPTEVLNNYERLRMYWRPIPVRSKYPKGSNYVLDSSIRCPNLDAEIRDLKMFHRELRKLWNDNSEFINDLSHYCGEQLDDFDDLYELLHELTFERDRNLSWTTFKIWSIEFEQKVIDRLFNITQNYLQIIYMNRKVQTLSVGPLLGLLTGNMRNFLDTRSGPRIFVYGTHDSKIITMLEALDLFQYGDNERTIDGGAAIVIELRQLQDQYYVRTFYIDDPFASTDPGNLPLFPPTVSFLNMTQQPENDTIRQFSDTERFSESFCFPELPINPRHLRCPIANFFEHIRPLEPYDWKYQCGLRTRIVNIFAANFAILAANLACVIILIFVLKIYSSRIRLRT